MLAYEEVPTPEPGPGEVLIAVHAVSVNRTLDIVLRQGRYERKPALPHVPGVDPVGAVAAVGEGVPRARLGARVAAGFFLGPAEAGGRPRRLGIDAWGGYAEYVKVPEARLTPIPDGVSYYDACVICRHFPTAAFLLEDKARLASGETVLIMGASGGLGVAGIQVAKEIGATVIAAAGAPDRVEAALSVGADFGIDYRAQDLAAEVARLTEGRGVEVVFENIGDPTLWPGAFASLAMGGRLVTAGGHGGDTVPLDVNRLYLRRITILGGAGNKPGAAERALAAAAAGRIKTVIDRVLPLSRAAEAHELVWSRAVRGKVLLDPTLG